VSLDQSRSSFFINDLPEVVKTFSNYAISNITDDKTSLY